MPPLFQFRPDLAVIVDLAVKCNNRIVVVAENRLVSPCQIDDLQPHRAQRRFAAFVYPLLVRAAVVKHLRNPLGNAPVSWLVEVRKSRNSTHLRCLYLSPAGNLPLTPLTAGFVTNIAYLPICSPFALHPAQHPFPGALTYNQMSPIRA